ncbi:zinc-ribbon domain containing protein [Candidatus Peregrinibacteria bacterium]|nr:zinc-ribbon domain containing protein [Candidatus Peregrinibacteria bacterium]
MPSEKQTCQTCKKDFLILEEEKAFYKRKNLPSPTDCSKCRQDTRLALRNERNLYKRKCDKCGQDMISPYSADSPYVVYCQKCFWEYTG